jgi:hypothetical protein
VPLFRRKPLHERLAEQEEAPAPAPSPVDTKPDWGEAGIHGLHRPREWDVVLTVRAPDVEGTKAEFASLPDGTLVVEEDARAEDLEPLILAIESEVESPYRAQAVRQHDDVWAVAARAVDLVELPGVDGDELTLTMQDGTKSFSLDGAQEFGSVPELERFAQERFASYVALASRVDGDLWEVRVSPL